MPFPVKKSSLWSPIKSDIDEKDIYNYVVNYNKNQEVYLYVATVNIDIYDNNRKKLIKTLSKDYSYYFEFLKQKQVIVKEIGAITITKMGYFYCKKLGMKPSGKIDNHTIFRSKINEITF